MERSSSRSVTVELTYRGGYFGQLGPFEVAGGWWQEVGGVAAAAEAALGLPVLVLRLLDGEGEGGAYGGRVRYHAESAEPPRTAPRTPDAATAALLGPAGRRAAWADADGLRAALEWAGERLGAPAGQVRQLRTWNLSGLYRLPAAEGADAWLKTTAPDFNAAEGEVIALLGGVDATLVPRVLAADPAAGRLLLAHVPGEDCWGPSAATVERTVPRLVAAQAALAADGRAAAAGLRDRTPRALLAQLEALLARLPEETDLTGGERARVAELVGELPATIRRLADCGLPETLLHGDFHPGNWRAEPGRPAVLLDFADACLGHPALDGLRARDFLSPEDWQHYAGVWAAAWRAHLPGAEPERALELAEPLYHLAYALRYQEFLDHIETSERPYHEGDPASELRAALRCGSARARS
ncbi:phosphotransferase family protein [Streptomyces sp. Y1]|uniref:Phosphotransferase family protein n=1 Tax=Streptomyces sp. Y1 TaxID=3238634 RepID=A0AB39TEY8_9ACTN